MHSNDENALKGRCFFCSAEGHWANQCPVKQGRPPEVRQEAAEGPAVPKEGKAKGKGKTGGKPTSQPKVKVIGSEDGAPAEASGAPTAVGAETAQVANPAADLAKEMTEVLRSLKLKKLGLHQVGGTDDLSTSLIDSGATAALRKSLPGELENARRVKVQLAVGEVDLWVSSSGTLLCEEAVQPILPMAYLASLGCVVNWTDKGISICPDAW